MKTALRYRIAVDIVEDPDDDEACREAVKEKLSEAIEDDIIDIGDPEETDEDE